jgi:alkylation response protein AidB-like acyl-CoA dehydrogenase
MDSDESVRQELGATARRFMDERVPFEWVAARADDPASGLDADTWREIVAMGWTGIGLPESAGGFGGGPGLLGVLHEEMGRSLYPGPFFSGVALAGPCLALSPDAAERLAEGVSTFTLAWAEAGAHTSLQDLSGVTCSASPSESGWRLTGVKCAVPDAGLADEAVVVARTDSGIGLFLVDLSAPGVDVAVANSIDGTRRVYTLTFADAGAEALATPEQTPGILAGLRRGALVAASFEAIGVAERVLQEIVDYAKSREQFGKPIGSFQAVSGPLADSYVDIQLARALAEWAARAIESDDAGADVAAASAKASAAEAAIRTVERAIQVAGGIGFAWEYRLHRYLRRSMWIDAFEGSIARHRADVASALLDAGMTPATVELMDDEAASAHRQSVRAWIADRLPTSDLAVGSAPALAAYDAVRAQWRALMCESGSLVAHWPVEYGGAGASDVITAIFREEAIKAHPRVSHGDCGVDLVAPLLMRYGSDAQKRRFLEPIRNETEIWTQGFSEPNAGSDLASLKTRAVKDGDDWVMNGMKTWSTYAPVADWIFLLARTDPQASRHRGISCFLVEVASPGIEIRPIRDIAGTVEFAEIFFTDVRVPAENMLGGENEGWGVAVMTLAHERVIESYEDIGELGFMFDRLLDGLRERVRSEGSASVGELVRDRVAELWCRFQAVRLVQYRCVLALEGSDTPPSESEIVKLGWSEVAQHVARLGLEVFASSPGGAPEYETGAAFWEWEYLNSRSLTIYAGTSEIIRSVVAERVLGLPRSR